MKEGKEGNVTGLSETFSRSFDLKIEIVEEKKGDPAPQQQKVVMCIIIRSVTENKTNTFATSFCGCFCVPHHQASIHQFPLEGLYNSPGPSVPLQQNPPVPASTAALPGSCASSQRHLLQRGSAFKFPVYIAPRGFSPTLLAICGIFRTSACTGQSLSTRQHQAVHLGLYVCSLLSSGCAPKIRVLLFPLVFS